MEFGREIEKGPAIIGQPFSFHGRDDWIRTSDFCVPNAALYQAEPRPELLTRKYFYQKLMALSSRRKHGAGREARKRERVKAGKARQGSYRLSVSRYSVEHLGLFSYLTM
jgi:hypothetical protein